MPGSLSWRETDLQNPDPALGRFLEWLLEKDSDTTSDPVMGGKARACRSWKKEKLERCSTWGRSVENVPTCTFGTKGRDSNSRNVLLP